MLFLDGVYVDSSNGSSTRFRWVKAPTSAELAQLTHTIAYRVGRFLERQGLLERDAENSYLAAEAMATGPPIHVRRTAAKRLRIDLCAPIANDCSWH